MTDPSGQVAPQQGQPGGSAGQFLRFSVVGVIALGVDWVALKSALWAGLDLYSGRAFSYLAAATAAWALNRRFTFRVSGGDNLLRQWLRYLGANAVGGVVNYASSVGSAQLFPTLRDWPLAIVAVGSLAGLVFNFVANKYYVFRAAHPRDP
jgi:putative flippase GtrA